MSEHRRSRRSLSEHEMALWREVTRAFEPLRPRPRPAPAPLAQPVAEGKPVPQPLAPASPSRPVVKPALRPEHPPLAPIDRRFRQRLSRGLEPIEARIDLHGLRQNEAHEALFGFLHRAQARGHRNVLVITGKGGKYSGLDERGVLRRQVPLWLRLPELRDVVLGFEFAHGTHGGEGALYVRLRRGDGRARP